MAGQGIPRPITNAYLAELAANLRRLAGDGKTGLAREANHAATVLRELSERHECQGCPAPRS
jgi:hypothetical protein